MSFSLSNHFDESAYERDLRNELLGLPLRRKLKSEAVPTLCLPPDLIKIDDKKENQNINAKNEETDDKMLPIELQKRREADALKRAETAERRKAEVNQIISREATKKKQYLVGGVTIESERSKDGRFINHKAVLQSYKVK